MWVSWHTVLSTAISLLVAGSAVNGAYNLDVNSTDSIKDVSKQMAADLMTFYNGNQPGNTPGLLPQPYYWWEAGAMMGSLVDYWYYTGDTTYNQITTDALLFQVGPYNDYMPPNQTLTEGNDDQGFWGMAVMTAAEYKFPDPPEGKPQWLALAQAVFNTQAARWDDAECNGGLRWQIFQWNNGYNYKNSISQGCFFNIAARLALYTGNSTYADWAIRTWDWMVNVQFMDESYHIYDGSHIEVNCSKVVPYQFSYNAGSFLLGAAAMYAFADEHGLSSDRDMWHERVDGLLNGTDVFFFSDENGSPPVMIEIACEGVGLCNLDQRSFKAYLSRWMAATTKWAPWTYGRIKPLLMNSAQAAAQQCTGGENGRMCGLRWANNSGQWDGSTGVGEQMAAMEIVLANMIHDAEPPVTNSTGGTSVGDPTGGGSDIGRTDPQGSIVFAPLTTGDRAGAIIVTVIICATVLTAALFMMTDENKSLPCW
ncbi:family 76 glycoside hydrolase [Truncatella angustata]|uniref:Mannan endo-1,6-alpha-mannosidase n=1 Tax=Truncatella angustata TaxID=152316 RepID=A0A9P8RMH4_9PEZI|nr:family 76 glycoside hydrolase [Truncatella angustata]KAH6645836.1 family 76 glycoside hydrolase [Truncatella angustata]